MTESQFGSLEPQKNIISERKSYGQWSQLICLVRGRISLAFLGLGSAGTLNNSFLQVHKRHYDNCDVIVGPERDPAFNFQNCEASKGTRELAQHTI